MLSTVQKTAFFSGILTFEGEKIVRAEVYFGWNLD